jgi:hypothetical protein
VLTGLAIQLRRANASMSRARRHARAGQGRRLHLNVSLADTVGADQPTFRRARIALLSLTMPLKPVADADGFVSIDKDFEFECVGDPALDRILLRCHVLEGEVRVLTARLGQVQQTLNQTRYLQLLLLGLFIAFEVFR